LKVLCKCSEQKYNKYLYKTDIWTTINDYYMASYVEQNYKLIKCITSDAVNIEVLAAHVHDTTTSQ